VQASLELKPDYGDARLWWERVVLKQQNATGDGSGGAAAGEGGSGAEDGGAAAAPRQQGSKEGGSADTAGSARVLGTDESGFEGDESE
jgi:hypothetical protein